MCLTQNITLDVDYDIKSQDHICLKTCLVEDVFAISALNTVLYASEHKVFKLALRCKRHPFCADDAIGHSFELCIDADLRCLRSSRRDLKAQDVAPSAPV